MASVLVGGEGRNPAVCLARSSSEIPHACYYGKAKALCKEPSGSIPKRPAGSAMRPLPLLSLLCRRGTRPPRASPEPRWLMAVAAHGPQKHRRHGPGWRHRRRRGKPPPRVSPGPGWLLLLVLDLFSHLGQAAGPGSRFRTMSSSLRASSSGSPPAAPSRLART